MANRDDMQHEQSRALPGPAPLGRPAGARQSAATPRDRAPATFLNQLQEGCQAGGLSAGRVLVAVSGGADSTAMLRGLLELSQSLQLTLVAAHLDHGLRGTASQRDAEWLQKLAAELGIPLQVERRDIAADATAAGAGLEETARRLRYAFLESTAIQHQCSAIAVAHTRDDQVETVLHHIVRGTGMSGLVGIPARRTLPGGITIQRPMLDISRHDVLLYLDALPQDYCTDDSNQDQRYTRNRIRHTLLPTLREDFNPRVDQAVLRLSRQARDVQDVLSSLGQSLLEQCLLKTETGGLREDSRADSQTAASCQIDMAALAGQPRHLVRECFRQLWQQLNWPRQKMGFDEWDQLVDCISRTHMPAICLPGGIRVESGNGILRLQR